MSRFLHACTTRVHAALLEINLRRLAVALVVVAVVMLCTISATSVSSVVWVNSLVSDRWSAVLPPAVAVVDYYTDSIMQFGPCHTDARCITVQEGELPGGIAGRADSTQDGYRVTIILDPGTRPSEEKILIEHELGHAFYLRHNPQCTSIMFAALHCNDVVIGIQDGQVVYRLAPETFTTEEQVVLRRN